MHRSTASSISRFMVCLSEKTVTSIVVEHKSVVAEPPAPKTKKPQYILGKNPPWHAKRAALHHFFDWTKEKHGLGKVESMRRERKMPRGLFAAFVRDNTVIKHHCTVSKKFSTSNPKFSATIRRYQRALEHYCTTHPVELDDMYPLSRSAPRSLTLSLIHI